MAQPEESRPKTAETDDVLLRPGEEQGEVRVERDGLREAADPWTEPEDR